MRGGLPLLAILLATPSLADDSSLAAWAGQAGRGWKPDAVAVDITANAGRPAAVLVSRKDDAAQRVRNEGLGSDMLDLNPRRLQVLARTDKGWRTLISVEGFVPAAGDRYNPCLADPLEDGGVAIAGGIVSVSMQFWQSCGSWGVSKRTYKFRQENGRFRLIGQDLGEFSRSSGQGEDVSVNYLTGRRKHTTGIAYIEGDAGDSRSVEKVHWTSIPKRAWFLDSMRYADCERESGAPGWCAP